MPEFSAVSIGCKDSIASRELAMPTLHLLVRLGQGRQIPRQRPLELMDRGWHGDLVLGSYRRLYRGLFAA